MLNELVRIGKRVPIFKVAALPSLARTVTCSNDLDMESLKLRCPLIGGVLIPVRPYPPPKKMKGASRGDPCKALSEPMGTLDGSMVPVFNS